jgi:tetratricopeptide (TPR) repeat protein
MVQDRHPLTWLGTALAVALLAAGCSLPGPYQAPPPPGAVPREAVAEPAAIAPAAALPEAPPPAPPAREHRLLAATRSLVTQARTEQEHGDLPAASMTLDRALRIEPTNPLLWIEIGRLRLAENDARQAEGCGRKALALASGDRSAQSQAGRVLADALRAQQRNQEAREIESQPYMN